jgi:hypothetical protein
VCRARRSLRPFVPAIPAQRAQRSPTPHIERPSEPRSSAWQGPPREQICIGARPRVRCPIRVKSNRKRRLTGVFDDRLQNVRSNR